MKLNIKKITVQHATVYEMNDAYAYRTRNEMYVHIIKAKNHGITMKKRTQSWVTIL